MCIKIFYLLIVFEKSGYAQYYFAMASPANTAAVPTAILSTA